MERAHEQGEPVSARKRIDKTCSQRKKDVEEMIIVVTAGHEDRNLHM